MSETTVPAVATTDTRAQAMTPARSARTRGGWTLETVNRSFGRKVGGAARRGVPAARAPAAGLASHRRSPRRGCPAGKRARASGIVAIDGHHVHWVAHTPTPVPDHSTAAAAT